MAQTAWYEKNEATFLDLLKAVRKLMWNDILISRKGVFESFPRNNQGLDEALGKKNEQKGPKASWLRVL